MQHITDAVPHIARQDKETQTKHAAWLFRAFHGHWGNVFLSRYKTGQTDDRGHDKGVMNALEMWSAQLSRYEPMIIRAAFDRATVRFGEFPPNLPQFNDICKSLQPRAEWKPPANTLGMSQALRSRYAAQAREIAARHARAKSGHVDVPHGLEGLKALVASAIAAAGGDEVAALTRLNQEIPARAAK